MKNKILPIIAIIVAIIAVVVLMVVPGSSDNKKEDIASNTNTNVNQTAKSSAKIATTDENGDVIIKADDLSTDNISFIKYSEDSKIELIAIKGEDGKVNVALGTCGSCNGSPNAYYNQAGDQLQCNNCGLTFSLDVIGVDGTGCHPIMIDEAGITRTDDGIKISKDTLLENESLFSNVVAH